MPPFFFNKKLILLLTSLILLVALVGFSLKERKQLSWPEQLIHDTSGWLQVVLNSPAQYVKGFVENVEDIKNVYEENKVLKKHLQDYVELDAKYGDLQQRYTSLEKQLHINSATDILASKTHIALVISRSFDDWNQQLTIDKGRQQGIKKNDAVVTSDGFIGKIKDVSQFTSTVTLITAQKGNNQISVKVINKNGTNGLIQSYDSNKNVLLLEKLRVDSKIKKGDKVVTSGIGCVYPAGLYIGKVKSVAADRYGLSKIAKIKPAANFDNLDYVDVVERQALTCKGSEGDSR